MRMWFTIITSMVSSSHGPPLDLPILLVVESMLRLRYDSNNPTIPHTQGLGLQKLCGSSHPVWVRG